MPTDPLFPSAPGTYVLAMTLARRTEIIIGALGLTAFEPGGYLYVGSALGPGGLATRLHRHLRSAENAHWHLDYFRLAARPAVVWLVEAEQRLECDWSRRLAGAVGLSPGPPRFGASDCRCGTHLYRADDLRPEILVTLDRTLHPARRLSLPPAAEAKIA
jgi:Uri superfamily endonuclease